MSCAMVAILFYILTVAAISVAARALAESPKTSKATTAAISVKASTVAPAPRKAGPAAALTTESSEATFAPVGGDEVSSPPKLSAVVVSPVANGPAEGPADVADADHSDAAALKRGAAIAGVVAAVATAIFY